MNAKLNHLQTINEKRKRLVELLGDEERKQYFQMLQTMFRFRKPATDLEFDNAVRPLLKNSDQWSAHYDLIFAINLDLQRESQKSQMKSRFQSADITEFMPKPQNALPPSHLVERTAASEFFMPDAGFIATRINLHVWENDLEGVEANVAELMVDLCHSFMKNILTAMISRKEHYKLRDKFQYGFGTPAPNPLIRNSYKITDSTKEEPVVALDSEDSFAPNVKPTLEQVETEIAFAYGSSKDTNTSGLLSLELLYDTLRNNPHLLGLHSISSVNLMKLSLLLEDS